MGILRNSGGDDLIINCMQSKRNLTNKNMTRGASEMWVYILSEKGYDESVGDCYLYTVGFYDPLGMWYSESDHSTKEKAAARVHYLNGGKRADNDRRSIGSCGKCTIGDCTKAFISTVGCNHLDD